MAELIAARDAVTRADLVELRLDGVEDVDLAGALRERSRPAIVTVRRDGLVHNTAVPNIAVDPADGTVTLAGRVLAAPPATDLPLNRRYLLG